MRGETPSLAAVRGGGSVDGNITTPTRSDGGLEARAVEVLVFSISSMNETEESYAMLAGQSKTEARSTR